MWKTENTLIDVQKISLAAMFFETPIPLNSNQFNQQTPDHSCLQKSRKHWHLADTTYNTFASRPAHRITILDVQNWKQLLMQHLIKQINLSVVTWAFNQNIPPMLLILFVENAFKHGISLKEKSWINIKLECAETLITFEVRNSIHNRFESDTEKDKSGIGLKNVAERLKLLYPAKHELNVSEDKNEFIVKLIIK